MLSAAVSQVTVGCRLGALVLLPAGQRPASTDGLSFPFPSFPLPGCTRSERHPFGFEPLPQRAAYLLRDRHAVPFLHSLKSLQDLRLDPKRGQSSGCHGPCIAAEIRSVNNY